MRWIFGAMLVVATTSSAWADHFHFGGSFGHRHYGPHGHAHFGFGLNVFDIARLNLYSSAYRTYGVGPMYYYRGPAAPSYIYDPGFYYGPPAYTAPPAPILYGPNPPPFPVNNPALFEENDRLRGIVGKEAPDGLGDWEPAEPVQPVIRQSNAEAKRRSIRMQGFGDEWFARRDYRQALQRYRDAAAVAPDVPDPRVRMAITYCALSRPDLAAQEIKRSLKIDPNWPVTHARLETLFGGAAGDMARNHMLLRLGDWVREDIRDPDRLLVMGTMLFLNNDPDQAMPFLKTSATLRGSVAYLDPFIVKPQIIEPAGGQRPVEPAGPLQRVQPVEPAQPLEPVEPAPEARPQIVKPRNAPPGDQAPRVIEFPTLKAPAEDEVVAPAPVPDAASESGSESP